MATDEDYMSFLTKANADPDEPTSSSAPKRIQKPTKQVFKAVDDGAVIPTRLKLVAKDAFYVSDADEPFEPVSLSFKSSTSLPDKITFAKLIRHSSPEEAEVEILDAGEWDAQGQYKDVVEAVRESVKGGDVRVYRVRTEGARAEYWVLGMEGGRMLGVRCLAIES
ncbi:hypothetical protein BJ878DRAFT_535588 [Calycina marina]|uniref:Uncharacterized protein n=1 Tax=Calycina marina TaxID=1763456 RepID=A0A9P7Z0L1_9HELO|nr:hypothetical protein BJ878DRAFT_535588 [Calycina marina]